MKLHERRHFDTTHGQSHVSNAFDRYESGIDVFLTIVDQVIDILGRMQESASSDGENVRSARRLLVQAAEKLLSASKRLDRTIEEMLAMNPIDVRQGVEKSRLLLVGFAHPVSPPGGTTHPGGRNVFEKIHAIYEIAFKLRNLPGYDMQSFCISFGNTCASALITILAHNNLVRDAVARKRLRKPGDQEKMTIQTAYSRLISHWSATLIPDALQEELAAQQKSFRDSV